jgi:hypothetical protein
MNLHPFHRVLIANRGEIAVRIIRACREAGVEAVAIYSEADATSRHVALADDAFYVGAPPSSESYLRGALFWKRPLKWAAMQSIPAMVSFLKMRSLPKRCLMLVWFG